MLSKLWNGEYSLAFSYWICYLLATMFLSFLFKIFGDTSFSILFIILGGGYRVCSAVGTWRAASKYNGAIIWPLLVKIEIIVEFVILVYASFSIN